MKLTDLSQLKKAMLKPKEEPPKAAPKPDEHPKSDAVSREDAAVIEYFRKGLSDARECPGLALPNDSGDDPREALEAALEAKEAALSAIAEEKVALEEKLADLERELAHERDAHAEAVRERDRLTGECGRLMGELRKAANSAPVAASPEEAADARPTPEKPTSGLLKPNGAMVEQFEGETREMILASLREAMLAAQQSGRERRAAVLEGVLAANTPSGELAAREATLRQILKDNGYFNDPRPLEKLGMKLISGRNHWKLQYGNVRIVLAKTPSDYRANQNAATEIVNRCF